MNRNQISQQPKISPDRKSLTSLVCGIISMILILLPGLFLFFGMNPMAPSPILNVVFLAPLIATIGLISGILGLKSTKKSFAIAGIILGIISLGMFMILLWIFS